jgi:hypothetical protein
VTILEETLTLHSALKAEQLPALEALADALAEASPPVSHE